MNMKILIVFIILLGCFSCTETEIETEYIIEEPPKTTDGISPGEIQISVDQITDAKALILWEYEPLDQTIVVTYEIAVNDSVVAYDIIENSFMLTKLQSNTSYSVSVTALDENRNSSKVSTEIQTMNSFIQAVLYIDLDFEEYTFATAISTTDGGVLVAGNANVTLASEPLESFIVKLGKNYSIEWMHVFPSYVEADESVQSYDIINDLLETNDGSYLIVRDRSISKMSNNGQELWAYENSDKTNLSKLISATQNDNGDFYFTGMSNRNWGKDISNEYILGKLSQEGKELWFKFGGTTLINQPKEIHIESDGNLLIMGSAESKGTVFDNLSDAVQSIWFLRTNGEGEFINQKFFVNKYTVYDGLEAMVLTEDNNYLLVCTISGSMPPYGYHDTKQRFLKITPNGEVLWDEYHYLNSNTGYFPSVKGVANLEGDSLLVLTKDDRGIAIATIDGLGALTKHIKLSGYPGCIFIKTIEGENYHCISEDGRIILFNHDGYLE